MDDPALYVRFLPLLGGLLALLCLIVAYRSGRRLRLVENLPTSKTSGVFIGLVELKGTAEAAQPLTSYLAAQPCVHYQYCIEEHWSRTVTETYTDSDGKTQTRTRHESGWSKVDDGGETIPFYLQDDCGVLLVRPTGAKLEPVTIFNETCGRSDPLYYAKGPAEAVADSDYRRRFSEQAIPLRAELYVLGQARERSDIVAPEIAEDKNAPLFLISTRTEAQVSAGFHRGEWGWGLLGLFLLAGSFFGRDYWLHVDPATRVPIYALAASGYLCASALGWVWMAFNSLIELRQRVRQAWSQVEVQLKRRHDLIPSLVSVVTGFEDHEKNLQTELAALRSQLIATPPGVAGPDFRAVNQMTVAIAERYPELKANELFLGLQKNLIDTEQRIALARGYFNEIATHFNTRLETVPERFVAALAAMKPQALMAANEFERAPVTVDFGAEQPGGTAPQPQSS